MPTGSLIKHGKHSERKQDRHILSRHPDNPDMVNQQGREQAQ